MTRLATATFSRNKATPNRSRGSVEFSLRTVVTMLIVLIGGALILYFMYGFLYQGKMLPLMDSMRNTISGVMDPYGEAATTG